MRTSVLLLGAAGFLTLTHCNDQGGSAGSGGTTLSGGATDSGGAPTSGGAAGSGGTTLSGGATDSGGATLSGGATDSGGAPLSGGATDGGGTTGSGGATGAGGNSTTTGGTTATGGASPTGGRSASGGSPTGGTANTGGSVSTGGRQGRGGTTSSGGATGTGGSTASGGTTASGGGSGGGGTDPIYQGPCDLISGGCAEAYSMTRAMTASYTGPLFQLGLAADKNAQTLDIGQTDAHTADMTTWSDYCGGTQSKCVVSKIYAQIHSGSNDLLPAVWKAPWGPDCSAGGYTCAARFTIEQATNLPILTTDAPQEYAIRTNNTENFATGINAGTKAMALLYHGKPVPNQVYCCGVFGLAHKYDAPDTFGTDFMVALAYGWKDSGGCCIAVNCGKNNNYCVGAEEEENNDLYDYGTSPVENAIVVTQFDPSANAVITYLNGKQVLSHSPPKANLNVGTAIHIGGGGDLSQPDPVRMREAFISNAVLSASEVTAIKANIEAFHPTLNYP
jgi:hypothetical protein